MVVLYADATAAQQWRKVSVSNFTIVTPVEERRAVDWATDFTQFIYALRATIPVNTARLAPLTVVLFPTHREFQPFSPLDAKGKPVALATGFLSGTEGWAIAGLSSEGLDAESQSNFYREGMHWYLSGFQPPIPFWVSKGLSEVFSTCSVRKGKVKWGEPIAEYCRMLSEYRSVPMSKLVEMKSEDLLTSNYGRSQDAAVACAQAWACVHYVMFGDTSIPRNALSQYVHALNRMPPEQAFKTAFGMTYDEMDKRLARYVYDGQYSMIERPAAKVPDPVIEPASAADVDEALGRLALCAGLLDKADSYAAALSKETDDARSYELRAFVALTRRDVTAANEAFEQAVKRNSREHLAYFNVGVARAREIARLTKAGGSLSQERVREAADLFERSLSLRRTVYSYSGVAILVEDLAVLTADDQGWLRAGIAAFPDDPEICTGAAAMEQRLGNVAEAVRLAERVLANPNTGAETRARATRLRERLSKTAQQKGADGEPAPAIRN